VITPSTFRARRIATQTPAVRVAGRAGIDRCRVSLLENGHIQPRPGELERLLAALESIVRENPAAQQALRETVQVANDLLGISAGSPAAAASAGEVL